ncbi:MAG: NAD-dependent epimerase/dehydratase family protein [Nitrospirae bacterium]|nr:MAG: NAD-dependent epimerase/dehydratase family protein [Nitrospirota bacterium]
MKVFVTGVAGFIGSKVAEGLLKRGDQVVGIDDLNDYYDPRLKRWRLEQLQGLEGFTFIEGDIVELETIRSIFDKYEFDACINLAARAGVRYSVKDPWVYLDTNVKGTINLLECCKDRGVNKFILASTSSLYGFNEMPFSETQRTDTPLAPYGATKKAAEAVCYSYHYLYGLDIIIPRYFTVYGPAGRPDMSIFKFIKNIVTGKPIPVFGDGKQKRDFTYIDDIAEGTIRCLDLKGYEIINLGNDNSVVLMDVINLIEDALGKKAEIRWLERHPADVEATWADITKAKQLLKWQPRVRIEEGIKRTVSWFKENRDFLISLKEAE